MKQLIEETLANSKEKVKLAIENTILDNIKSELKWQIPDEVNKIIQNFINENVIPEVKNTLFANKDEIVKIATDFTKTIVPEIAKKLQENVAKNLASSWNVTKLIEAIFR